MLEFDPTAVERNAREATTEDLLDRITAFRLGMEPGAIPIIEAELGRRGLDRAAIEQYSRNNCDGLVYRPEGFAYRCSYCRRPAVFRRWGWHRLWGLVPVMPCILSYCESHASMANTEQMLPEEP